jgi:multimeric flavodoxin WrbA
MKRVLGVVGSPRKNGNTDILVSKILEGAEQEGAATDVLYLKDLKIRECDGCHVCWEGKPCSKRDDLIDVYPKLVDSDAIVFGTPVYWYGPTALMKAFIDRFVYFNCPENRARIRGKSAALAAPFEEDDLETASLLVAMFEKCFAYLEMDPVGNVLVPGVSAKGDILKKDHSLQEGLQFGKSLARRLRCK